jgi:mRNA deadenylase 3'-5' endonuclease subunit Ccr4
MFWSLRCFEKEADQREFALRELFEERPPRSDCRWKSMHAIHNLLDQHQELQSVTRDKVGQVLQVVTLRLKDKHGRSDRLVIGNTHLFYHPMADHIRVMQAYAICRQMDEVRRGAPSKSSPCPLIICGDLNSDPLSGTLRLLLHREVESDHFETWKNLYEYSWDKGEHVFLMDHGFVGNEVNAKHDPVYVDESFRDAKQEEEEEAGVDTEHEDPSHGGPPKIELPPCFPNLISGYVEIPEFTNYAVDFTETLDYILASEPASEEGVGFEASAAAPVPTSLEMKDYVAMPNEFMPSDHVSIVCDLKWKHLGE